MPLSGLPFGRPAGSGPRAPIVRTPPRDLDADLADWLNAVTGLDADNVVSPPDRRDPIRLTFALVSEVPVTRLSGAAGLALRTYQVDFRGTPGSIAAVAAKVEALRLAAMALRGPMGTNRIHRATYRRLPTRSEAPPKSSPPIYRASAEVGFWYRQHRP